MELERDFKGIWIPKNIYLDDRLNALDKIILVEIDSLDATDEGCYASNQYLADFCKCSETKVSSSISKLVELGYLEIIKFDGRKRYLKSRVTKIVRQDNKNCKAGLQNLKDINISNNIDNISICSYYNDNVHSITPIEYEKLLSWCEDFSEDMIKQAIKIAVSNNARSLSYIEAILRNWKSKGIKNISDIETKEKVVKSEVVDLSIFDDIDWLNDDE